MRYNYIRNAGFAILILLQIILSCMAVHVSKQAQKGITTINKTLHFNLYTLNKMDRVLKQAFHLYELDINLFYYKMITTENKKLLGQHKDLKELFHINKYNKTDEIQQMLASVIADLPSLKAGVKNNAEVLNLNNSILTLKSNIWKHDATLTIDKLGKIWQQAILAMTNLRNNQETLIANEAFSIQDITTRHYRHFFILVILSLITGVIFSIIISYVLSKQLNELILRTKKNAGGDLNFQLTRKTEDELKLMKEVFEHSLEGIFIIDRHDIILKVNPSFSKITGYHQDEVIGKESWILDSGLYDPCFFDRMKKSLADKGMWEGEIWIKRKNNEPLPAWFSINKMTDSKGRVSRFIGVFHDISDIKNQDELIHHQALHDALTGLPNRLLLFDRIELAISGARRYKNKLAILFIDLDNFKKINDSLGHTYGDALLQALAKKLTTFFRPEDTVCRMGGDEFVALIVNLNNINIVMELANRILQMMAEPILVKGHKLYVSGSIGVSVFPEDGNDRETLIKNADIAMYRAKNNGKNNVKLFTETMAENIKKRLVLEEEILKGMATGEFTVFFQPKIDLSSCMITGLEALARWHPANRGQVGPMVFIPVCEEAGLILELGKIILETACREGKKIIEQTGNDKMTIAVNLSLFQLMHHTIIADIKKVITQTGLSPSQLEFEISETAIMTDVKKAVSILNELSDMGIAISIDDFGTGYSSLYYLKTFPIKTLKIDRRFIKNIVQKPDDKMIVETVIAMAKELKLKIVAEGVENRQQLDLLKEKGCDMVQGFYFSKPLPTDQMVKYIRSFKWHTNSRDKKSYRLV